MLNLRELGRKQRVLGDGDPKRQEHALMLEFARKESEMIGVIRRRRRRVAQRESSEVLPNCFSAFK